VSLYHNGCGGLGQAYTQHNGCGGTQGLEEGQDQGERKVCDCGKFYYVKSNHDWWTTLWWRGSKHQKHGGGGSKSHSTKN